MCGGSRGKTEERRGKKVGNLCKPRVAGQRRRSAADREAGDLSLGVIGASRTGPFTQSTPFPISPDKIAPCLHLPPHLSCASLVFGAFGTREASASRSRKDAEGNRRKERKKKHKQEESEGAQVVFLHFGLKVRVLPPLFARCHVGNMRRGGFGVLLGEARNRSYAAVLHRYQRLRVKLYVALEARYRNSFFHCSGALTSVHPLPVRQRWPGCVCWGCFGLSLTELNR